jgi:hypothetical protein
MSRSHNEERFPDDVQDVVGVLRDQRPALTPLELDRVKLRAMSGARRSTSSPDKGFFMRSRLTTLLTVGFLTLGTGGALALSGGGGFGFGGDHGGSAGYHEYRCQPGHGYGDGDHCHTGPPGHDGGGKGGQGGGQGGGKGNGGHGNEGSGGQGGGKGNGGHGNESSGGQGGGKGNGGHHG